MKHNVIKGRFDSFFEMRMGKTPPRDNPYFWNNGIHSWVAISDMGKSKYISETSECISDLGISACNMKAVPSGTVIMSFKLSIGKVAITTKPLLTNEAIMAFIPKSEYSSQINKDYLYYYLLGYKWSGLGNKAVMGLTLNKASLSAKSFFFPPMEVQERIVAELDEINGLIEAKREQLKQLDLLSQSIFYTMFGDPISNPMGFPVKCLSEICETISTGITYKPDYVTDDGVIVLRSNNIHNSKFTLQDIVRILMPLKETQYVHTDDILMCSRNGSARLVGKVCKIPKLKERMSWGAFMTIIRSKHHNYLFQYLQLPAFRSQLTKTKTSTVNQITIGMLKGVRVPFPPLNLQEQFAAKVEAIESRKADIESTIKELQTLLDSRMDYWFN